MVPVETTIPPFSCGTLQQPEVQLATFGRLLDGRPDVASAFVHIEPEQAA